MIHKWVCAVARHFSVVQSKDLQLYQRDHHGIVSFQVLYEVRSMCRYNLPPCNNQMVYSLFISELPPGRLEAKGVLYLLNFVPIHSCLIWCPHSITMEVCTPAQYKTSKIHQIKHTPVLILST